MCDLNVALKVRDCAFNIYLEDMDSNFKTYNTSFSWGVKRMYMDIAASFRDIPGVSRGDSGCFVGDSLPILDE